MKELLRKITIFLLSGAVKILLARKHPEIIGITGSAGKTTTKEFAKALLEIDFEVLASEEGYNTEIGAPLALFGQKAPKSSTSIVGWLLVIIRIYLKAIFVKDFPDKVILEMGADRPGDIKFLTKILPPKKGIVLTVLPTHLLEFKTVDAIAKEKSELVFAVPESGKVFLNNDDKLVKEMATKANGQVVTFGTSGADYCAQNIKTGLSGLEFDMVLTDKKHHFRAGIYGEQMIYPLLAAIALAREEHINIDKIIEKVRELKPFKGRMNVIEGVKESIIIDDSYNSSPGAAIRALDFLSEQKGRKIAVLGNMNELGEFEEEAHRKVGAKVSETVNMLVTVGKTAEKYLAGEAKIKGLKQIFSFEDSTSAGKWLKNNIKAGDVVLVKGSQNLVRLEKAVEQIMAHPEQKENILVRQSEEWKKRS